MKRKEMTLSNMGLWREFTTVYMNFANMTDKELAVWQVWVSEHNAQDYPTPRERSYFRVNAGNLKTEVKWRKSEIPF